MTMTNKARWTLVGIVAVAAVIIISCVAALAWAVSKLWAWWNVAG